MSVIRPRPGCRDITEALGRAGYGTPRPTGVVLVGFRPWFAGHRRGNERGIYDDAIVIFSPTCNIAFNANTDPSIYRKGKGRGEGKGVATLKPGLWAFTVGLHRGQYTALRQRGAFTVVRDGDPPYEDTGAGFGINIHRGSRNSTSSLGCQTIHPDQWESFISTVRSEMKRYGQMVILYALVEWREVV